jgi:hypothetical protein
MNYNNGLIFLFVILLIGVIGSLVASPSDFLVFKEGYSNFNLKETGSNVHDADAILTKEFPSTGRKTVTKNNYSDIWWYYPIFKVGSFAQITNNLRYRNNPDDGKCRQAEFCGALYKDNQVTSNIINPLPPVPDTPGTRINYYRTQDNLFLGAQPGALLELPAF